jgi:hypothetical protein
MPPIFIKFTFGIINVSYISKVLVKDSKYYVHVVGSQMNTLRFFNGDSKVEPNITNVLEICKDHSPTDHMIMRYWINSM